jgi:hypothetical protein
MCHIILNNNPGLWKLFIADEFSQDDGTVENFRLTLHTFELMTPSPSPSPIPMNPPDEHPNQGSVEYRCCMYRTSQNTAKCFRLLVNECPVMGGNVLFNEFVTKDPYKCSKVCIL